MDNVKRGFSRKSIDKTIRYKLKEWLSVIHKDLLKSGHTQEYADNFISEINNHIVVTGGAIASMLQGDLPNDYDVYFDNQVVAVSVANYYLNKLKTTDKVSEIEAVPSEYGVKINIKSAGFATEGSDFEDYRYFEMMDAKAATEYFEKWAFNKDKKSSYQVINMTSNAITLSDDIQIILRFVGDPAVIHKNFDFIHCTNYWTSKDGLVLNLPAVEAIMSRRLEYVGSLYPICSIFRIRKFIRRGWTITAGECLKICWDIANLDLNNMNVLQEQLVGVDAAYFAEVMSILKKETNDGKPLERTYLFELINRVFNEDTDDAVPEDITLVQDRSERFEFNE